MNVGLLSPGGAWTKNLTEQMLLQDYGSLKWELVLCLFLSWVLVGLSLIGGIQNFGKVAYVITLSPYFVLTALLAYAAQRPV